MTEETFEKYENLRQKYYGIKVKLSNLDFKATSNEAPLSEQGILNLSYTNGSFTKLILDKKEHVVLACNFIRELLNKELEDTKKLMDEL